MDYEVKLEIFEGPLDLLLHLINKNEVDIFDIPIATITDQYLGYLELMKTFNINVAGDFLVMASTLIHIKSKMLLPGSHEDEEEEDPRTEIMRPLLEYMQFKEMAEAFSEREILDRDVFARTVTPYFQDGVTGEEPELDVSLFQLIDAFKRIVDQRLPGAKLTVQHEQWSVKDKTELIIARLKEKGAIFFREIFSEDRTVSEFIVTFLALLELVHMGLVKVLQPTSEGDIRLIPSFDKKGGNGNGS
ncbi:MAG: segregation/condensation protein A [Gammaproteobacteria bacterium]|nr:segregation/condensation protein A [Gammaproteobacteria bacterium]